MTSADTWIPLATAVARVHLIAGGNERAARMLLCEWLNDGMIVARADRVIDHKLAESRSLAGDEARTALDAMFAGTAQPLAAWELPTEAVFEECVELPSHFWGPIDNAFAELDVWTSGRITCADATGTRERRVYVGIKIVHEALSSVLDLYGYELKSSAGPSNLLQFPKRKRGRPAGATLYGGDADIVAKIIAACDADLDLSPRRAILGMLDQIEPKSLDDEAKIKRIRRKVLAERPAFADRH